MPRPTACNRAHVRAAIIHHLWLFDCRARVVEPEIHPDAQYVAGIVHLARHRAGVGWVVVCDGGLVVPEVEMQVLGLDRDTRAESRLVPGTPDETGRRTR